jgi:hypothetical protein
MKQLGSRPMFELGDNTAWFASGMKIGDAHGGSFRRSDAEGLRLGFAVRPAPQGRRPVQGRRTSGSGMAEVRDE